MHTSLKEMVEQAVHALQLNIPVYPLNTISQQSNQILMSDMTNSFNFHSEFFFCLPPTNPEIM